MQQGRPVILILTVWSLLGVPALCKVGLLLHNCELGHVQEHEHESDCACDLCDTVLLRQEKGQDVAQWLCDTLSDLQPFVAVITIPLKPLVWHDAGPPPPILMAEWIAQPTATTVLLI